MTSLPRTLVFTLLACLPLVGCAATPPVFNCNQLTKESKDFAKQVRWRETGEALQWIKPAPDGPRPAWEETLKPIEVVDCTVKELNCVPAKDQAHSIFILSYLRSGSAALRTTEIPITWQQQPTGTWHIISPPPKLP